MAAIESTVWWWWWGGCCKGGGGGGTKGILGLRVRDRKGERERERERWVFELGVWVGFWVSEGLERDRVNEYCFWFLGVK